MLGVLIGIEPKNGYLFPLQTDVNDIPFKDPRVILRAERSTR